MAALASVKVTCAIFAPLVFNNLSAASALSTPVTDTMGVMSAPAGPVTPTVDPSAVLTAAVIVPKSVLLVKLAPEIVTAG